MPTLLPFASFIALRAWWVANIVAAWLLGALARRRIARLTPPSAPPGHTGPSTRKSPPHSS